MLRKTLSDEMWEKLLTIMKQFRVYHKKDLRLKVEGMLYRIRNGVAWRCLPESFGKWRTIYKRFNEWSKKGLFKKLFYFLVKDPDLEWGFMDATIVKAHQHSSGAATRSSEAIGKSRGGNTTKIHVLTESGGLPVSFLLSPGQAADSKFAYPLLEGFSGFEYLICDRGYDSQALRSYIKNIGSKHVIPRKKNSRIGNKDIDWCLYKYRHQVENLFARIKHFRGLATRYDKLKRNFESVVSFVFCLLWLPM